VVTQTTTPQAAVTSTFLDQLQMTTPTLSQLPSPPPQEHLSLRCQLAPLCPVRKCLHIFRVSLHHGRGFGSGGLLPRVITEQISSAIASDPEVPGPEATQAPTSGAGTTTASPAPPPPAPGSSSPTWSLLSEDSDNDDASGFSI
jgi:hypothetical protein